MMPAMKLSQAALAMMDRAMVRLVRFFRDLSGFLRLNSDDLKACANELS